MTVEYYSGVGSRLTPVGVGLAMTEIAKRLEGDGYILRSGGAAGADHFFERGVVDVNNKHIYLPKKGMFGNPSPLFHVCDQAIDIAKGIHRNWDGCSHLSRMLHARNVYQVLGKDLNTLSKFLLCWTERGEERGGTRTAIKLAQLYNVPVLNFGAVKSGRWMDAFENFYMFMDH